MILKARLICVASALFFAVPLFGADALATPTISPGGDHLLATSTNVTFQFGTKAGAPTITCELGQTVGVIPTPTKSEMTLEKPIFQDKGGTACGSTGLEGAKFSIASNSESREAPLYLFSLKAESEKSGLFKIPGAIEYEHINGLEFVDGLCRWGSKAGSPLGTWANGTKSSPLATPSTLTFSKSEMPLEFSPNGHEESCPAALIKVIHESVWINLTATFIVNDTTHPNEPVLF